MVIRYSKSSLKFLAKQEKSTVNRLRVGSYRVIYWYTTESTLEVLYVDEIGNRGDIYK